MFDSQNTHGSSHPMVTLVKGELMLSSGLSGHSHACSNTYEYKHFNCFVKRGHLSNKHTHKIVLTQIHKTMHLYRNQEMNNVIRSEGDFNMAFSPMD